MSRKKTSLIEAQCIYCRDVKPAREFTREHVIHRSMTPGFEPTNLTLLRRVCRVCNGELGKQLDQALARDTWEAVERYKHGLKPIDKLNEFTSRNVELTTSAEPDKSHLHGAQVKFVEKHGKLNNALIPHVVLEVKEGQPIRLYKNQLLGKLDGLVDFSRINGDVRFWAETEEEEKELRTLAERAFKELGRTLQLAGTYVPGTVQVFAEITYDIKSFRAFAKIAFNYMAKTTEDIPGFALSHQFDEARRFIRYGEQPSYKIVEKYGNVGARGIFGDEKDPKGHFVDLRLIRAGAYRQVIARVTLFNKFAWRINLCPDYRGLHLPINNAHFWDLEKRVCQALPGGTIATSLN